MAIVERALAPLVEVRKKEVPTAVLLFAHSFLAMAVWNTIKRLTRSQFIRDLGADNLPYVLLAAGLLIGVPMAGYAWLMARLPRRWGLPIIQIGMGGLLIVFWVLLEGGAAWVSVAADGVAPGEKVVVFEYVPLFAGLSADEARGVADIARTVRLEAGSPLFAASDSPAIWIVLNGRLALEGPDEEPLVASSGDVVSGLATLAGCALARTGRVLTSGVALRIDREELVDLWADRPTLLRQLLATTLRSVDLRLASPATAGLTVPVALAV